jgi:primary-amine oxidase
MTLLLRPRNFFARNPALDVPPSYCSTPSQVANKEKVLDAADKMSTLVVAGGDSACCKK